MPLSTKSSNHIWNILFICWLIATIAALGSLFFSEVMHFPPCIMCWYQRICMYPLVVLFLMALFPLDTHIIKYASALVSIGLFFAIYQNLLYYKILPEAAQPCAQGVSCTSDYINWFGFITIQLLSLIAFSLLFGLLFYLKRKLKV
ncbi:MAG: disulfide bond formation protein B [Sulfurospirillaceae bacterium]|nr:disulfide bond formation protein B [Sulfurospirillaceae bacterium]MDD2825792.1 disulfide bond formation protein B [Sulfurospirillaceae bacterium]